MQPGVDPARISARRVREHDRALVAEGVHIADQEWRIHILVRACWDDALAHEVALRDCDRILVALNRSAATHHLNRSAIESVRPHMTTGIRAAVAINDPYCTSPESPDADPRISDSLVPPGWKVHLTRCGDFYRQCLCEEGVEKLFEDLLR